MNTQSIKPLLASYDVTSQGNRLMYMYGLYSVSQGWTWALVDSRLTRGCPPVRQAGVTSGGEVAQLTLPVLTC